MLALDHAGCRLACEREFQICVTEGPGYDRCVVELTQGIAPLAAAGNPCVQGCIKTATMTALSGGDAPCTAACATEFLHCCAEGPGYHSCVQELRSGQYALGAVCVAGCALTSTMTAQAPATNECSAACATEFVTKCMPHHTPNGCTQCRSEIDASTGPLSALCVPQCTDAPSMVTACPGGTAG